ncbi:hypothetical protein EON80_27330 [bacterium]|nr:MAG: hypothetical protein EON80_27330 [bacterium]
MKNLADSVLDYLWFLEFSDEDICDPDYSLKLLENLAVEIKENYSDAEKEALQDAAKRRLEDWLQKPDEHGYSPRGRLTDDQKLFLEALASGRFNGYLPEDGDED